MQTLHIPKNKADPQHLPYLGHAPRQHRKSHSFEKKGNAEEVPSSSHAVFPMFLRRLTQT